MSTLTKLSTEAQIWESYDDNASYEEDHSVAKAEAFITACRFLTRRRPTSISRGERSTTLESLQQEIKAAQTWIQYNPSVTSATSSRTRYGSMEAFRE